MHQSVTPRLRNNYFLCRAEKEQGGTRGGMDAVLEVLAAITTGRKDAVMLRMGQWDAPQQNSSSVLIIARALLLLQLPGGRNTSPSSCPAQAGSRLHGTPFLANTDYRSYLIPYSPAQLRVHNSGMFLLLLLGCPWANATPCALEEWQKFKKICFTSLVLILLIRFLYSSSPFSVFSDLTCS